MMFVFMFSGVVVAERHQSATREARCAVVILLGLNCIHDFGERYEKDDQFNSDECTVHHRKTHEQSPAHRIIALPQSIELSLAHLPRRPRYPFQHLRKELISVHILQLLAHLSSFFCGLGATRDDHGYIPLSNAYDSRDQEKIRG